MIHHLGHLTFAAAHRFRDDADEFFGTIDDDLLDRFLQFAVHATRDDFRLGDLKFIIFAAHHLDQNRELQLAASGDFELIR